MAALSFATYLAVFTVYASKPGCQTTTSEPPKLVHSLEWALIFSLSAAILLGTYAALSRVDDFGDKKSQKTITGFMGVTLAIGLLSVGFGIVSMALHVSDTFAALATVILLIALGAVCIAEGSSDRALHDKKKKHP